MGAIRFEDLVLASLFHDLGKIAQRAGAEDCLTPKMDGQLLPVAPGGWYSHKHAWYTHGAILKLKSSLPEGFNAETIARIASAHHNPSSTVEQLITEGDRISSGADRTPREIESEHKGSYIEQACLSIFSSVRLGDQKIVPETFLELGPLEPDRGFPKPTFRNSRQSYNDIWNGLLKDLGSIHASDFEAYISIADSALERWTWSIPSTTIDQPDISLYDHMRTTVAFSSALYRYHEAQGSLESIQAIKSDALPCFALVTGDLSGIQKYIFDLKSTKYNAKILRSRSFLLRSLSESAIRMVCREFGLTSFSCLSVAGGRFTLILPALPDVGLRVDRIRKAIEMEFIHRFDGILALNISEPVLASRASLHQGDGGFSNLFSSLMDSTFNAKQKKLQQGLSETGHVIHRHYEQIETALQSEGSICSICGARASLHNSSLCEGCDELIEAGTMLPKSMYLGIFRTQTKKRGLPLLDNEYLQIADSEQAFGNNKVIARIDSFESGKVYVRLPYTVPMEAGQVKEFEKLAHESRGVPHLAMFKADLDNLGIVFSRGLGKQLSASRYASLSRTLDYFFTVMVRHCIESDPRFKDIYTVFSGGDDLCVIGPWNAIIDFSIAFHRKFELFTGSNPWLSVSGGIAIVGKGLPVGRMAEEAEAELERAKDYPHLKKTEKNAISLFGVASQWNQFEALVADGSTLVEELENGGVSHGAVYALLEDSRRAESFLSGDIGPHNALWKSHFEYAIRRSKASDKAKMLLKKYSVDPAKMIQARIPASIALYSTRIGGSR